MISKIIEFLKSIKPGAQSGKPEETKTPQVIPKKTRKKKEAQ